MATESLSLTCRIGFSIGQRGNLGRFEVSRHFAQGRARARVQPQESLRKAPTVPAPEGSRPGIESRERLTRKRLICANLEFFDAD
jgi:hypothetical protein